MIYIAIGLIPSLLTGGLLLLTSILPHPLLVTLAAVLGIISVGTFPFLAIAIAAYEVTKEQCNNA